MVSRKQELLTAAFVFALVLGLCGARRFPLGPGGGTGEGRLTALGPAATTPLDTTTVIFTVGQTASSHTSWDATATLVNCSATWAWDELRAVISASAAADSGDTTAKYDDFTRQPYAISWQSHGNLRGRKFPRTSSTASIPLVYFPFKASIPAHAEIVSATLCLRGGTTSNWDPGSGTYTDSLFAVLMTNAADSLWLDGPNTGTTAAKLAGLRAASWVNQIQPIHTDDSTNVCRRAGYKLAAAITDTGRWSPPIAARKRPMDWGVRGVGWVPAASTNADSVVMDIDVTRPVQYGVNGSTNNGFAILLSAGSTSGGAYSRPGFADALLSQRPFLKVVYRNRAYTAPWPGGKEVAFTLTSDDGLIDANNAWTTAMAARGYSMTINPVQAYTESADSNAGGGVFVQIRGHYHDLARWYGMGMEIGTHSRQHAGGFVRHSGTSTGLDSLYWNLSPAWLDSGMAADDGDATKGAAFYAASPIVGKTVAAPLGYVTLRTMTFADSLGYLAVRTANWTGRYSDLSIPRPSPRDSCSAQLAGNAANYWMRSFGLKTPRKMNMFYLPVGPQSATLHGISQIFGTPGSATTDSNAIKRSVKGWIEDAAVTKHNGWMIWLVHALNSSSHGYTTEGLNANQLNWALNAMEESGNVWVCNTADGARYMKEHSTAYDHPDYGTNGAWESVLTTAAGHQLWRKPN